MLRSIPRHVRHIACAYVRVCVRVRETQSFEPASPIGHLYYLKTCFQINDILLFFSQWLLKTIKRIPWTEMEIKAKVCISRNTPPTNESNLLCIKLKKRDSTGCDNVFLWDRSQSKPCTFHRGSDWQGLKPVGPARAEGPRHPVVRWAKCSNLTSCLVKVMFGLKFPFF